MQRLASEQNGGSSKKNSRKSTSSKNNSSKTQTSSFSFWKFISGDKMIIFYGVLLILFALLLFLSIGSFYFNAHNNVAFVESDHAEPALNIAKGVGATLSYFFVQFFFGVISIGFPFLILLYGIRLVAKKSVLPLGRTTFAVLMTMAWVSITLGLVGYNSNSSPFLAGYFGNFICQFLVEHVGMVFSVLIDIAILVLVLVFCYEMNIQGIAEGFQQMAVNARERKMARRAEKVRQAIPVTHTQHEDQPDLYITDHGTLSDEYKPKVYDLVDNKEDETESETETEKERANDIIDADQLFEDEEAEKQTDDIPFDFVNTNDKAADEINDELSDESDDELSDESGDS